jgi:hypothetical protein
MNKWLKYGILGLLVFGAIAVVLTGTALAQDETPVPGNEGAYGWGKGFGHRLGGQVALEAAAGALGMTPEELSNQLWGGKTLADLADEAGVDLQEVRDAVEAAQQQATRDAIEQAVQAGNLTREHADWLLEGLDKGFLGGFGGFGRGGFLHGRGFRGFGPFPRMAPATPSSGT